MWSRARVNDPTVAERARSIIVGQTKGEELTALLGAQPTMRMPGKEFTTLGYSYSDTKANGLVLILFNFTRSSTVADTMYVLVDAKTDVVRRLYVPPVREVEWCFWPFGD